MKKNVSKVFAALLAIAIVGLMTVPQVWLQAAFGGAALALLFILVKRSPGFVAALRKPWF